MDKKLVAQKLLEIEHIKLELEGHPDLTVKASAACLGAAVLCLTQALEVAAFRDSITSQKMITRPFLNTREEDVGSVDDFADLRDGFM